MQEATDLSTRAALWQTFTRKAEASGAVVKQVASEPAAAELVSLPAVVATRGLAKHFPKVARAGEAAGAAAGVAGARDGGAGREAQRPARDVVGAALFAVAETGSVVLSETAADRAACFLADRLWLLVHSDAIVATLDGALDQLAVHARQGARYLTLMTGPSRTADIERTLTIGVHGPRELVVVVVGGGAGGAGRREGAGVGGGT